MPGAGEKTKCDDVAKASAATLDPYEKDPYCKGLTVSPNTDIKEILYLLYDSYYNKGPISPAHLRDLLQELYSILRKPAALEILLYLVEFKAATARVLRLHTNLCEKSIYNALEFLEAKGLVVKSRPLCTKGRPVTVYAIFDYTPDEVVEAIQQDRITRTSGYAESKRITQLLLDDYFEVITKSYKGTTVVVKKKVIDIIKKESGGYDYEVLWKLICPEFTKRGYAIKI